MTVEGYEPLLRWYPPQWRERYGDEMAALLEDTYATASEVPLRQRACLAWSGLAERARSAGFFGWSRDADVRLRGGALLALCGWAFYVVAAAMFVKVSDRWSTTSPRPGHWVATGGISVLAVAMGIGCGIVLLAAVVVLPAFVRFMRAGRWREVRGTLVVAVMSVVVSVGLFSVTVARAHGMSTEARNGGDPLYNALFLLMGVAFFVAVGCATAAVVSVARRLDLSRVMLRTLGGMAIVLVGLMGLTLFSLVAWWATEAAHAPAFLAETIGNGAPWSSTVVPPTLLAAGLLMTAGLAVGLLGLVRIIGSLAAGGRTLA